MADSAVPKQTRQRNEEWAARLQASSLFTQLSIASCRELAGSGFFRTLRKDETLWERDLLADTAVLQLRAKIHHEMARYCNTRSLEHEEASNA